MFSSLTASLRRLSPLWSTTLLSYTVWMSYHTSLSAPGHACSGLSPGDGLLSSTQCESSPPELGREQVYHALCSKSWQCVCLEITQQSREDARCKSPATLPVNVQLLTLLPVTERYSMQLKGGLNLALGFRFLWHHGGRWAPWNRTAHCALSINQWKGETGRDQGRLWPPSARAVSLTYFLQEDPNSSFAPPPNRSHCPADLQRAGCAPKVQIP